jgi:hypothetical protein
MRQLTSDSRCLLRINLGRGGGRGGDGGRGPDLSNVKSLLSNIVLAKLTPNFSFYLYSSEAKSRSGAPIESLSRRGTLFNQAIWKTLLKDTPPKQKEDL